MLATKAQIKGIVTIAALILEEQLLELPANGFSWSVYGALFLLFC